MATGNISWEQFNVNNPNQRMAFEDLCRLLFKRMFFDGSTIFHSESNNPGVEIDPIYSNNTKNRISYQSIWQVQLTKNHYRTIINKYKFSIFYLSINVSK